MSRENKIPFNVKDNKLHVITKPSNQKKTVMENNNNSSGKSSKRKYREIVKDCKIEQESVEIEKTANKFPKLISSRNSSIRGGATVESECSTKNEQIVALITYKTNELTREQQEAEKLALIITDDPTVPKLTRAKARELNKTPIVSFPSLSDQHHHQKHQHQSEQLEIISLINQELNSDEEDEEFTMQEGEEIVSDDGASDFDSCPNTPIQNYVVQKEIQLPQSSPMKFSEDGCFKIPLDKTPIDNHRIAARTRSKLCLEQTTIEAIQSSFVPPDVEDRLECLDELGCNDEEWMRFLNDFTKPLNHNNPGDDDDPINDPEYVATEKEPVEPAEELRDVNITKKELKDLVEELLESLNNEDISLDCIHLDPTKNVLLHQTRNDDAFTSDKDITEPQNHNNDITFCPNIVSTPTTQNKELMTVTNANVKADDNAVAIVDVNELSTIIPVGVPNLTDPNITTVTIPPIASNTITELIAIPVPDQPNCYQLARVVNAHDAIMTTTATAVSTNQHSISNNSPAEIKAEDKNVKENQSYPQSPPVFDKRYDLPYDNNFTKEYISVRRHLMKEYMPKFENLRYAQVDEISSTTITATTPTTNENEKNIDSAIRELGTNKEHGKQNLQQQQQQYAFTYQNQHQCQQLQQQLRIHVQMLTQTFLQTHCHPDYWRMGEEVHKMLQELKTKSNTNSNFNAWNLYGALKLIDDWRSELKVDSAENKELMQFIYKEMDITTSNNRQIPKFHPRIMDKMLNSNVFMYPEYLPRMPFTHRVKNYEIFAPAEAQLIAMGLEKHLKRIMEKNEKVFHKSSPLSLACKRLCRDTIWGKTHRRVWDHIKTLQKAKYYNPIKYFFEHNYKAPAIGPMLIIGFVNGKVLPPKECVNQLPLLWKCYVQGKKNLTATKKRKQSCLFRRHLISNNNIADRRTESCKTKLPQDIVDNDCDEGEEFVINTTSDCAEELLQNSINQYYNDNAEPKRRKSNQTHSKLLTINVNYMFDGFNRSNCVTSNGNDIINNSVDAIHVGELLKVFNKDNSNDANNVPGNVLNDCHSEAKPTLYNNNNNINNSHKSVDCFLPKSPLRKNVIPEVKPLKKNNRRQRKTKRYRLSIQKYRKVPLCTLRHKCMRLKFNKYHEKRYLKKYCQRLCKIYKLYLQKSYYSLYKHSPVIQHYYRYFKALELYTNLLKDLKMFCRQHAGTSGNLIATAAPTCISCTSSENSASSSNNIKRRERLKEEDDCNNSSCGNGTQRSIRKINRQEENIKHMLLPDNAEEANRKDAFYAYNFYERVEEAFKASKQPENYVQFNNILTSFNPAHDNVADLYYKMESLFLPHHPELAEVFLTFLLPSDAAEIGKFFEHFIITNMNTFINKLNIYFNKQPAQIRKIYNCLNELADDTEVTMKKVENKILPLLKGNQFLIDWFMQQFPESIPPERLFSKPENINLKECQNKTSAYDHVETVNDILDSPTGQQISTMAPHQQQRSSCQLKYINGRIFYGSKVLLPAKLSFMANDYYEQQQKSLEEGQQLQPTDKKNISNFSTKQQNRKTRTGCCHNAIQEYGEKRLQLCCLNQTDVSMAQATAITIATHNTSDDIRYKSEEDDVNKGLIIDVTVSGEEETPQQSSIECCDDNTLRAHAMRLNPTYYGSTWLSGNWEKCPSNHTPAVTLNSQFNTINVKKGHEIDGKISPRKIGQQQHSPQINNSNNSNSINSSNNNTVNAISGSHSYPGTNNSSSNSGCSQVHLKEKRKSPCKKIKSSTAAQLAAAGRNSKISVPMVVIHDSSTSSAVACAKRLKTLIDEEERQCIDTKERLNIIARTKSSLNSDNQMSLLLPLSPSPPIATIVHGDIHPTNSTGQKIEMENSGDCEALSENFPSIQNSNPNLFSILKFDLDDTEDEQRNLNMYSTESKRKFINNTPITIMDSDDDNNKVIRPVVLSSFSNTRNTTIDNINGNVKTIEMPSESLGSSSAMVSTTDDAVSNVGVRSKSSTDTTVASQAEVQHEKDKPHAWTRDEDKIILLEMKFNCQSERDCHDLLYKRLAKKLNERSLHEIKERHNFLINFLAKLQDK